ncbi:putative cytochrome P450 oxidoreductase [Halenospora varia]|nr:putative cytochrome P450 oxidoreductase [Halenospora varia]
MLEGILSNVRLIWAVLGIAVVFLLGRIISIGSRPKNYPPGPPTLPLIGNLHLIPKKDIHLQYQKWAQQYGPIFSLKLAQQTLVVLADGNMIRDLVDKRGANYADRQQLYMRELWDDSRIIMRGYDDLWKVERKLYHAFLNINTAQKYVPYQELETLQLCIDLIRDPENFVDHISRATGSIAASMTYGFRLPVAKDKLTQELLTNSHGFFNLIVGSQVLDWYKSLRPLVRLLPRSLNPLAIKARKAYKKECDTFTRCYIGTKEVSASESSLPCFSRDIASAQDKWRGTTNGDLLTDHAAAYIAGISFEGGADTSRYTLQGFVKAMTLFPEVQAEAQREIDRVVGSETLPSFKHFNDIPYVRGTMKESLRWMPTAINGAVPHASMNDDDYNGYRIPAGAGVVLAVWSANNDSSNFANPRLFDPNRHNQKTTLFESAHSNDVKERGQYTFGAGRRMCPGMHVAETTLLHAMTRILWAFEISRPLDDQGEEIYIDPDAVTQGLAAAPVPFKCIIKPRSEGRVALLRKEWANINEKVLDRDGNYLMNILS